MIVRMAPVFPRWLSAALLTAALVAVVTAVIALLDPRVPALGLHVLYVLAVVPIALIYGAVAGAAAALVSVAAFDVFFLAPHFSVDPGTADRWSMLAAFLGSALVVSQLAARAQREAHRSGGLADEHAALRRVATLVVRGVPPTEVYAAVVREVGQLLGAGATHMARYERDGKAIAVAAAWSPSGDRVAVGTRLSLEGDNVARMVWQTGRPARTRGYEHAAGPVAAVARQLGMRAAVGAPIVVDQRLWGVMVVSSKDERRLPPQAEPRIAEFTELLATAIGNAESHARLARLAEEQAALRRVATLVARGAPPEELFAAVAEEVGRVLLVENVGVGRYEADETMTIVAISKRLAGSFPLGSRWTLGGTNVCTMVFETGRSARIDSYADASGPIGVAVREQALSSAVGAPIVVEGRLWGLIITATTEEPLPGDAEARLASFTDLVATAIANIEARAEVAASRARIVAAADAERRRVVRDLHDGAQQRLVHAILTLQLATSAIANEQDTAAGLVAEALRHAQRAHVELRELAHGILPQVLTRGGLRAGVEALASRMPVPVDIDVSVGRLPSAVEATAYFVVAEALTNVAKHAHAAHAEVTARLEDGTLGVRVRDDGVGGARREGSGLVGLADRLAALHGELRVESADDGGTLVAAAIPLAA
jgi:signal transduction histidine kinase